MSEIRVTRRDYTQESVLHLLGKEPSRRHKSTASISSEDSYPPPFCWMAHARAVPVGKTPVTVLQLEAKPGKLPFIVDILIGCSDIPADNAFHWTLEEQKERCSTTAATLTGFFPEDDGPGVYAWENGIAEPGIEVLAFGINQRATFRWVPRMDAEPVFHAPYFLGLVCCSRTGLVRGAEVVAEIEVDACIIGKNKRDPYV